MSRTLTANVVSAVTADQVWALMFVELQFASGTLRLTNAPYDFLWNGFTWQGAGNLLAISAVTETPGLDAKGVALTLSGVSASLVSIARTEDYQGRTAKIWFAPLSADFAVVTDPYLAFQGRMDTMPMDVGQEATITLNLESRLLGALSGKVRRYNHQDQIVDYPDDRGLEYAEKTAASTLRWGITPGAARAFAEQGPQ